MHDEVFALKNYPAMLPPREQEKEFLKELALALCDVCFKKEYNANLSRQEFLEVLKQHNVPPFQVTKEELDKEFRLAQFCTF